MNTRTLILAVAFLSGYIVNDFTKALGLTLSNPVQAYSRDFERDVRDIVSGCEVIVYDGGSGEVIC